MMRLCTLLGLLGGLFLVGWLSLAVFLWRREREASRRHQASLRLLRTDELEARAWRWGYLGQYADTAEVKAFRALLEQRRYAEILQRWRELTHALYVVGEAHLPLRRERFEGPSLRELRDYVEALHERQQRGE